MLKLSRLAALLIAGAIVSAPALAAEKGKAFATVNGQPISQSVYNAFVAEQRPRAPRTPLNCKTPSRKNWSVARSSLRKPRKRPRQERQHSGPDRTRQAGRADPRLPV